MNARLIGALVVAALLPTSSTAQGAGSTGAQVLQFIAGGRAAALTGAYTAASSDADVLFYNPAGAATLRLGASLAYETFVEDIALASFAGAFKAGALSIGLSGLFLDYGSVVVITPDPIFGGNTGTPSGGTESASEGIAKITVAMPMGDRLRLGASAGYISSTIASESGGTPLFDLGAQYDLSFATLGASLRNAGGGLGYDGLAQADLPTEARLGAVFQFDRPDGLGAALHTDLVARVQEGSAGFLIGAEAGYRATAQRSLGAVARVGFSGAEGDGNLGALRLGAGISMQNLALDYVYQNMDFFGAVHRFGVRWSVPR